MSSHFFWFVYFTPDDVNKVKAVFIMVLDRTTGAESESENKRRGWDYLLRLDGIA